MNLEAPLRRYLCIGYLNRQAMDRLTPSELASIVSRCEPHMALMYATDRVALDAGLSNQVWGLQRLNDSVRTTEAHVPQSLESIGSVQVIEARSDEEALQIARLHPSLQLPESEALHWRMEVRPLHYFHSPALIRRRSHSPDQ